MKRTRCRRGHDLTAPGALAPVRGGESFTCRACRNATQRAWRAGRKTAAQEAQRSHPIAQRIERADCCEAGFFG